MGNSESINNWLAAFLHDRKMQNFTDGTMQYYRVKMTTLQRYCAEEDLRVMADFTPLTLRRFLEWLVERGHNPGGQLTAFKAVAAFLNWYEREAEPDNWKNPAGKVKAPRVAIEPIEPIPSKHIAKMEQACGRDFPGLRDRAILLMLLDTGIRAAELAGLNIEDVNPVSGEVLIRSGKGRKPRTVFLGAKARKALRSYLRERTDSDPGLWVSFDTRERMTYMGLRWVPILRAREAGVPPVGLHAFRRQFALSMLRNGTDLITLSRLMGHAKLDVLRRYLAQTDADLREAHAKASPVDNLDI